MGNILSFLFPKPGPAALEAEAELGEVPAATAKEAVEEQPPTAPARTKKIAEAPTTQIIEAEQVIENIGSIEDAVPAEPTPEIPKEVIQEPIKEPEPVREPTPPIKESIPEPLKEPTPEPIREPTPEPIKEPTPEPIKEPTPELIKEPTPEPIKEPTPEPIKEPTPEPVVVPQAASPIAEVVAEAVIGTALITEEIIDEPIIESSPCFKAPTPEPIKEPTPEPIIEPNPEPCLIDTTPDKIEEPKAGIANVIAEAVDNLVSVSEEVIDDDEPVKVEGAAELRDFLEKPKVEDVIVAPDTPLVCSPGESLPELPIETKEYLPELLKENLPELPEVSLPEPPKEVLPEPQITSSLIADTVGKASTLTEEVIDDDDKKEELIEASSELVKPIIDAAIVPEVPVITKSIEVVEVIGSIQDNIKEETEVKPSGGAALLRDILDD